VEIDWLLAIGGKTYVVAVLSFLSDKCGKFEMASGISFAKTIYESLLPSRLLTNPATTGRHWPIFSCNKPLIWGRAVPFFQSMLEKADPIVEEKAIADTITAAALEKVTVKSATLKRTHALKKTGMAYSPRWTQYVQKFIVARNI
jgi:hypothetical protein